MKKLLSLSMFIMFNIILSSCRSGEGKVGLELPRSVCSKEIVFDAQIKLVFPNTGPLSLGFVDNGIVVQVELPGVEIEEYIGPPPIFKGYRCLTLIVFNQGIKNERKQVAISFQDGYKLRITIQTEYTTEFVFSSGRMAVSSGYDKPRYMEYDYLTNTLTVDARNRKVEYFIVEADDVSDDENIWFCSRHLEEGDPKFLVFSNIFDAWFRDLVNRLRNEFLGYGSIEGTLQFWMSFIVIIIISFYVGWMLAKKNKRTLLLLLWSLTPIVATVIYMHILYFDPNCPLAL